jgi:hypothetical protein
LRLHALDWLELRARGDAEAGGERGKAGGEEDTTHGNTPVIRID